MRLLETCITAVLDKISGNVSCFTSLQLIILPSTKHHQHRADYIMHTFWANSANGIMRTHLEQHRTGIHIMLPELQLDDHIRLRKPHACGGYEWRVVRLGADIGLECLTCGRRVLLTRRKLARRVKAILPRENIQGEA